MKSQGIVAGPPSLLVALIIGHFAVVSLSFQTWIKAHIQEAHNRKAGGSDRRRKLNFVKNVHSPCPETSAPALAADNRSGEWEPSRPLQNIAAAFDAAATSAASTLTLGSTIKDPVASRSIRSFDEEYKTIKKEVLRKSRLPEEGLSRFHQRLIAPERQIFVTGSFPLFVSIQDSPTRRWLNIRRGRTPDNKLQKLAASQVYINGTTIERSLASYDRLSWLDEKEIVEHGLSESTGSYTIEFLAEVFIRKPGYVNILPRVAGGVHHKTESSALSNLFQMHRRQNLIDKEIRNDSTDEQSGNEDILWTSDFSIARRGGLTTLDTVSGNLKRMTSSFTWPNEMTTVPPLSPMFGSPSQSNQHDDAILVSDGFLVPGRDNGGIYVIINPGQLGERKVRIAGGDSEWFYHKATWVDITEDGRKSILTARARRPKLLQNGGRKSKNTVRPGSGQLLLVECPRPFKYDEGTGVPLEKDGSIFDPFAPHNIPWKTRVLDEGPDVMFSVADLDKNVLTRLDSPQQYEGSRIAIDTGSTVNTVSAGDTFSHVLVTSHECKFEDNEKETARISTNNQRSSKDGKGNQISGINIRTDPPDGATTLPVDGGSVFAYKIPKDWKNESWERHVVATGFRVRGQLGNMINPGAPGFCYTFYPRKEADGSFPEGERPLIGVSGDCAEAAYIFRPKRHESENEANRGTSRAGEKRLSSTSYELMCEIECGATVGSIAVGYSDFCSVKQQSGFAKIYVPCYEKDKILVFALGDGQGEGADVYEDDVW